MPFKTKLMKIIDDLIKDEQEAIAGYTQALIEFKKAGLTSDSIVIKTLKHISDEEEEHISELTNLKTLDSDLSECTGTQVTDIEKMEDYPNIKQKKSSLVLVEELKEQEGNHPNTHKETVYTVYDCYGEIDTFNTRQEAFNFIEEHKDDEMYSEEYGVDSPEFRIEKQEIDVYNKVIHVKDDLTGGNE